MKQNVREKMSLKGYLINLTFYNKIKKLRDQYFPLHRTNFKGKISLTLFYV